MQKHQSFGNCGTELNHYRLVGECDYLANLKGNAPIDTIPIGGMFQGDRHLCRDSDAGQPGTLAQGIAASRAAERQAPRAYAPA
jgi:hypothetical protein